MLCRCGNLSGKLQWNDNQELTAIGAHDQHVGAFQPPIKFAKSIAPASHLDPAIDAEDWHGVGHRKRRGCGGDCRWRVRNKLVLPIPVGPTTKILAPRLSASRWSAVTIFILVPALV
jgi:hypothetical protein